MKKITLENGKTIEISDESYQALVNAVKEPTFAELVNASWNGSTTQTRKQLIRELAYKMFGNDYVEKLHWLHNKQSHKDLEIYLYQLYWKSLYDAEFEPDFKGDKYTYYIYYNNAYKKWGTISVSIAKDTMTVYFSDIEKAEQCIEDLKSIGVIE